MFGKKWCRITRSLSLPLSYPCCNCTILIYFCPLYILSIYFRIDGLNFGHTFSLFILYLSRSKILHCHILFAIMHKVCQQIGINPIFVWLYMLMVKIFLEVFTLPISTTEYMYIFLFFFIEFFNVPKFDEQVHIRYIYKPQN